MDNSRVKISTGFLLNRILKIKGKKYGNIEINSENALVLCSKKEIEGEELYKIILKIQSDLKRKINIKIELEIIFIE